jgi:D-lactate dehydrogenase
VDGLCATACPVGIDTGQLTKRLRHVRHSRLANSLAVSAVRHFEAVERGVRAGLWFSGLAEWAVGGRAIAALSRGATALAGPRLPRWIAPMPAPAPPRLPLTSRASAVAVYFPSCLSRMLGPLPDEPADLTVPEALVAIAGRAGKPVWIPKNVSGCCCGVPFASKGYDRAHREMAARTVRRLFEWSDGARLPVVVDTSPCAFGLRSCGAALDAADRMKLERLTVLDSIEFAAATLLPSLHIHRRLPTVTLHPVCSVERMGLEGDLRRLAAACSKDVFIPPSSGCCGFAGDRGWLVPELTAAASALEAAEVRARGGSACYSSSRTCEIGMTRATGRNYRSFLYLIEWASRPGDEG